MDKGTLWIKLGHWKHAESYHHKWRWNYAQDWLYKQSPHNNKIRYYTYKATVWRHYQFHNTGPDNNKIQRDFTPATPVRTRNGRQRQIPFTQLYPFPRPTIEHEPEIVRHMIRQLHPSLKSLVQSVEQLVTKAEIINVIAFKKSHLDHKRWRRHSRQSIVWVDTTNR
jgi:hypothetical protein